MRKNVPIGAGAYKLQSWEAVFRIHGGKPRRRVMWMSLLNTENKLGGRVTVEWWLKGGGTTFP